MLCLYFYCILCFIVVVCRCNSEQRGRTQNGDQYPAHYIYLKINLNAFSVALVFLVMILGYDIYSDELKQILNSQLY